MRRPIAAPLLLLVVLAGCGHKVQYTALNAPPRPLAPREPASVEIFTAAPPARPFVEVGLFEIEQESPAADGTPAMMQKLRMRAAAIGCDALVVTGTTDRVQSVTTQSMGTMQTQPAGTGTYQGTGHGHANVVRAHRAACIVYQDPTAAPPASAPPEHSL